MIFFISVEKTVECIVAAVIFAALFCACFYKPLGILQSCGYSGKKLLKWVGKKNNLIFTRQYLLCMLCALSCAVISLCFSFCGEWAAVVGLASYLIFFVLYVIADKKVALRSPAAWTARFKRLYIIVFVLALIFVYLAVALLNFADFVWGNRIFSILRYVPLALFPLLIFPIILLGNLIAKIYEIPHNKRFVKKAKDKLEKSDITVIGITGSYGKTSVKQILFKILSGKFRVLATPRSHNTPMGLALTVNNSELKDYDVFIAEMGARHLGDIAELCEICPPTYSVITGICSQHLESFGTEENIVKAKGEILTATEKEAVIAADCIDLFKDYSVLKSAPACVKDVECNSEGSTFTLEFDGVAVKTHTCLLGRQAAENIALAAEIAHKMGMTVEEISSAVEKLEFIEHRLQLIKSNGVNILDDGYNSNVKGAAAAIETLKSFGGKKICVTPGLVELGVLEENENRRLGSRLVGLDVVILVGDTLIAPVKEGYLESGGNKETLFICPNLFAAEEELKNHITAGDTVLFLNDLPDIY